MLFRSLVSVLQVIRFRLRIDNGVLCIQLAQERFEIIGATGGDIGTRLCQLGSPIGRKE